MTFNTRTRVKTPDRGRSLRVAYIMSRFPKLTETFVLYEMLAVERLGVQVEVYPLLRQREAAVHDDARPLVERAHYHPFISIPIILAQFSFLFRRPGAYCRTWWEVLSGTWGSWNFFIGALGIFPKAVRFAYEMERQGIDHVHAHFANHPAVAALVIHRLTGIPFSFTAHAHDLHVERRMLGAKVRASKFAVTVSEFNRRIMLEECDPPSGSKVRVIHCGVDPDAFANDRRPEPDRPLEIVCVAALRELKGHRYLIDACQRLLERGVSFRCHLIGDGPLRPQIESQIASSNLQHCVFVHGGLTRPDVMATLAASDVAVLASVKTSSGRWEGIPVALMEAMAAGLPVVASATSGIPELVQDGRSGTLVPPEDAVAIADALELMARDRTRAAQMGAAGRERVLRDFNQHASALELAKLFAVT